MVQGMEIAITGSSGLIGSALTERLLDGGHRPIAVVRHDARPDRDEIRWDPTRGEIDAGSLEGLDAVVNLAGAGIGDRRWSPVYKEVVASSRIVSTALLASALAGLDRAPARFLSGSAIGFYGNRGDEILTETSAPGQGFLAEVVQRWEGATSPATEAGISTAWLRTGIVLSGNGGVLTKMLPLFRLGLGGRFGRGRQYQSWITIDDVVDAIIFLLDADVEGPVNLTAPHPVTNATFTGALGRALHRPTLIPIPPFGPKLLLGSEMAQALLFDSQRVEPAVLTAAGYHFHHADLDVGLAAVLGTRNDT
jgi:uncharacterized protein (TIGR01777 family)